MEIEDEESQQFEPDARYATRHPDPILVIRRYWKILLGCTIVAFLLVLAATLPPLFVQRSENQQEERNKATTYLSKAETGITNLIRLAFIPAASLGLWVTGEPNFLVQVDNILPEIADHYYDGNSPFQVAARKALDTVSSQLKSGTILGLSLAPHGSTSSSFPLININSANSIGTHLLGQPHQRRDILDAIFNEEFTLNGPLRTPSGSISMISTGGILVTRFPIFYQASNCSCHPSSPTANDVAFRLVGTPPMPLTPFVTGNTSLSSLFSYGKLGDNSEKFSKEGGRFPTEVVFKAKTEGPRDVLTMFCDIAPEMGLMGLDLEDYGIEGGLNMSIDFLPECRFFWGFTNLTLGCCWRREGIWLGWRALGFRIC